MRTAGDDVAEVLAPARGAAVWTREPGVTGRSRRPGRAGPPRIDVVVVTAFRRLPQLVTLLDDAVGLVAGLDEDPAANLLRAHALADLERHDDLRRATTRIFGSPPGAYGAGLLPLMDSRSWRDDADLAEVYAVWGGHAYGRGLEGRPAREDMEHAYRRIAVAVRTPTPRADIADSDDYYQYHGGMVASVRHLTVPPPLAYVGDSTRPTRSAPAPCTRVGAGSAPGWSTPAGCRRCAATAKAPRAGATVDYLSAGRHHRGGAAGLDVRRLTAAYVLAAEPREFLERSKPGRCGASPSA